MPVSLRSKFWVAPALLVIAAGCRGKSGPQFVLESNRIDLGTVRTEDTATASLKISNKGSQPVDIGSIDFGCGCTTADYPKRLEPGGSGEVKILFKPNLFWNGKRVEKGIIRTSDPFHREVAFTIEANLEPPLRIEPPSPHIVKFVPSQPKALSVQFAPRADKATNFTVEVKKSPYGAGVFKDQSRFTFHLDARYWTPGDHEVPFEFNSPMGPIDYSVVLQASDGPVSNPSQIELHLPADKTNVRIRELHLYCRKGAISVTSISVDDPALQVTFERTGEATRAAVSYLSGWEKGSRHQGAIHVHLQGSKFPTLDIPYDISFE